MKHRLVALLAVGVLLVLAVASPPLSPSPARARTGLRGTGTGSTPSDHINYIPLVMKGFSSAAYLEKIYTTPDYLQTDPDYGGLPGDPPGAMYCGPVSVSNSLMWLDNNGFDNLVAPDTTDRKRDQFDLIVELGSATYMDTSLDSGTGVYNLTWGVNDYISDKGYQYVRLGYQGWRYHPSEFSTGVDVPDLDWVKLGIRGYGSVWLNVGWYTHDAQSDEYTRIGGHWVTLVGYGHDGSKDDPDYLIIHDPGSNAFANEYALPERINSGTLNGNKSGLPRSAAGFHKLMGGILDGVVVLEMPTPAAQTRWPQSGPAYCCPDRSVDDIDNSN